MLVNFLVNILTTNILFQISHLKKEETELHDCVESQSLLGGL